MSMFKNSKESVDSSIMLWDTKPTKISTQETYNVKVHPVSSIYNSGTINFVIPKQPRGMLSDIEIISKITVSKSGTALTDSDQVSVVNNLANSLWTLVDVYLDDRMNIMQSMKNAYAYQTFMNYVLNSSSNRADYIFATELFKMDTGKNKNEA